jgi:hypothetical protein
MPVASASMMQAEIVIPAAGTRSMREVRATRKPPVNMPAAEPTM